MLNHACFKYYRAKNNVMLPSETKTKNKCKKSRSVIFVFFCFVFDHVLNNKFSFGMKISNCFTNKSFCNHFWLMSDVHEQWCINCSITELSKAKYRVPSLIWATLHSQWIKNYQPTAPILDFLFEDTPILCVCFLLFLHKSFWIFHFSVVIFGLLGVCYKVKFCPFSIFFPLEQVMEILF